MFSLAPANASPQHPLRSSHRESYLAQTTMASAANDDKPCPGCHQSVLNENGGVVIAFGSSFFHVECFKCAKCKETVTADTNLLLLSDGQPVCSNCSYSCSVCKLPILDEAIMTGDDSYHAHCFKCKSCRNRIDELMFAKTHNGIYCMNCHNQRVARSRRHVQKQKEREKEKEKARMMGTVMDPAKEGSHAILEAPNAPSSLPSTPAMSSPVAHEHIRDTPSIDTSIHPINAHPDSLPNPANAKHRTNPTYDRHIRPSSSSPSSPVIVVPPSDAGSDISSAPHQDGSTPNGHLFPTDSTNGLKRQKSFDDGIRAPHRKGTTSNGESSASLTLPSKGRSSKRNSINPGMTFDMDAVASEFGYAPSPPASARPRSPINGAGSGSASPVQRSPALPLQTNGSHTLERTLSNRSVRDRTPSRQNSQSRQMGSPASAVRQQQPHDDRGARGPASSLSIDVEKSRAGNGSGSHAAFNAPSPSHRVDVPHSVESGTDTEPEGDSPERERGNPPPLPLSKGPDVALSPPIDPAQPPAEASSPQSPDQTSLSASPYPDQRTPRIDRYPGAVGEGSSEESLDQVRHSTFIAPALPPIRISLGAGDFSDLLKSYNDQRSSLVIQKNPLEVLAEASSPDTPASNESWRSDLTPTSASSANTAGSATTASSVESEGLKDDASMTTVGVLSPPSSNGHAPKAADVATPENSGMGTDNDRRPYDTLRPLPAVPVQDAANITVTAPGSAIPRPLKGDPSDLIIRRLRDALADSERRGATHVNLDEEFVQTIIHVVEQRKLEHAEIKGRLDHFKRASQQYIDGLTVAQSEYEAEFNARRDAELEVTRLRVLLNGQVAQMAAMSNEARQGELHQELKRELSENLSVLEQNLSRLRVERDVTLAEVAELEASKGMKRLSDEGGNGSLKRSLTTRLESIRTQYQNELIPLNDERSALLREIAELKAARNIFLEETTVLNARNEELASLTGIYSYRVEQGQHRPDNIPDYETQRTPTRRSTSSSGHGHTGEYYKVPSAAAVQQLQQQAQQQLQLQQQQLQQQFHLQQLQQQQLQQQQLQQQQQQAEQNTLRKRGWLTGVRREQPAAASAPTQDLEKTRMQKIKHTFQQISVLRVSRCDHCGDKLWGSQVRCSACNYSAHHRCQAAVQSPCSPQNAIRKENLTSPLQPSMFGRDLIEQIRADSRGGDRMVPIIVEKCIEAVEHNAMDYEGIYRKTGGSAQSKMITTLFERADYDSFDLRDDDRFNDICSVTSVLKTYFRSLPNPLLTYVLHDEFMNTSFIKDPVHKSGKYADLVKQLPTEHYYTLRMLMHHLYRVHERNGQNLMTARNLGVVFGPTLMRSRIPGAEFSDMAGKALTIEWLIENAPVIFPPIPVS